MAKLKLESDGILLLEVSLNKLLLEEVEEFDEDIAQELQARARDVLLTKELASEEELGDVKPDDDLLELEGMERKLAFKLASNGIVNRENLAECAVDDVIEIEGMDEKLAGKLIMKAREHWFAEESESSPSPQDTE